MKQKPLRRDRLTRDRIRARSGQVEHITLTTDALRGVLDALVALEFDDRRTVLRWAAEFYSIDPGKLGLP